MKTRLDDPALRLRTCPPSARGPSLWRRLSSWFDAQLDPLATRLAPGIDAPIRARLGRRCDALRQAQRDFAAELADLPGNAGEAALEAVWRAGSLHDLWHVRAGVFEAIARHFDQQQALLRLTRLNAHFPTPARAARAGTPASR